MKIHNVLNALMVGIVVLMFTGCTGLKDSLNKTHQNIQESAKDSSIAIHSDDVKPIPASAFESQKTTNE
jgi:hypothetical protein